MVLCAGVTTPRAKNAQTRWERPAHPPRGRCGTKGFNLSRTCIKLKVQRGAETEHEHKSGVEWKRRSRTQPGSKRYSRTIAGSILSHAIRRWRLSGRSWWKRSGSLTLSTRARGIHREKVYRRRYLQVAGLGDALDLLVFVGAADRYVATAYFAAYSLRMLGALIWPSS